MIKYLIGFLFVSLAITVILTGIHNDFNNNSSEQYSSESTVNLPITSEASSVPQFSFPEHPPMDASLKVPESETR